MRYVMTFMNPTGGRKGTATFMFTRDYIPLHCPYTGVPTGSRWESTEELIQRMLDWLDSGSFGRTLGLEDIAWAVFPQSESSIVADLTEEQLVILKLSAPTRTVRFRPEEAVLKIVQQRQTRRERTLTEPLPRPRYAPKPEMVIVKKPARHRLNLGRVLPR
jgi:hypothetical protein